MAFKPHYLALSVVLVAGALFLQSKRSSREVSTTNSSVQSPEERYSPNPQDRTTLRNTARFVPPSGPTFSEAGISVDDYIHSFIESHPLDSQTRRNEAYFFDQLNTAEYLCWRGDGAEIYTNDLENLVLVQEYDCERNPARGLYNNTHAQNAYMLDAEYRAVRRSFQREITEKTTEEQRSILMAFDDHYRRLITVELDSWEGSLLSKEEEDALQSVRENLSARTFNEQELPLPFVLNFH